MYFKQFYLSSIAASLLKRRGFHALFNIVGGTSAWINAGYPVESQKAC
jgi:rhodanese-related sulfurtransferase